MSTRSSFTFILLLTLFLAGACSRSQNPNEDHSNPSGNNHPSDEGEGNHANDPQSPPGTHYPGSGGPDSAAIISDTLHKGRL